ncbi:MAG TPA: hypothetical protein VIL48_06890 [Acidimicrobiales bacterium]|jgi:hypothetical protein
MAAALLSRADLPRRVPASSHIGLLAAVRDLGALARDADGETLRAGLRSLRDALVRHMRAEEHVFRRLPPISRRVVVRGQRELIELVDDLAADPEAPLTRARLADLGRRLARQARLEARLLTSRVGTARAVAARPVVDGPAVDGVAVDAADDPATDGPPTDRPAVAGGEA